MKIVIIGGGPAGMLAAIAASKKNNKNQVVLVEKNEKLGKKMFISGKGRCNLTNNCDRDEFLKNVVRNPKFLYSAYSEFSNVDLKKLVEDNGCPLKVERGNRVFPVSDKSYDVIDALKRALKSSNVKVMLNAEVIDVRCADENSKSQNNKFSIDIKNGEKILADRVIIATGGISYPSTGSTGYGYKVAEKFSINVMRQSPSLVPFNIKEVDDCKEMQGLTLKNVAIKVFDMQSCKKVLYEDFGELLFTHFGVSGPVILSASCFVDVTSEIVLSIDLKPALSEEQIDARLLREFSENNNKKLKSIIETLLPSSMIDVFMNRLSSSGKDVFNINVAEVDKNIRRNIVKLLKEFNLTIISKRDFNEAIVTRGGIDVKEINPKTMESKKIQGLYFAGEVLDIDAMTGGFNIQIASTTGYVAGYSSSIVSVKF